MIHYKITYSETLQRRAKLHKGRTAKFEQQRVKRTDQDRFNEALENRRREGDRSVAGKGGIGPRRNPRRSSGPDEPARKGISESTCERAASSRYAANWKD